MNIKYTLEESKAYAWSIDLTFAYDLQACL
jgi:hypothetical protein